MVERVLFVWELMRSVEFLVSYDTITSMAYKMTFISPDENGSNESDMFIDNKSVAPENY
jgi:hypothetical protein